MLDWSAVLWRASRRSNGGQTCVECATLGTLHGVRDSHDRQGPMLVFDRRAWEAFLAAVKRGDFD